MAQKFSSTEEKFGVTKDTITLMILLFIITPFFFSYLWENFKIFGALSFLLISILLYNKISFIRKRLRSLTYRIIDARKIFYGVICFFLSLYFISDIPAIANKLASSGKSFYSTFILILTACAAYSLYGLLFKLEKISMKIVMKLKLIRSPYFILVILAWFAFLSLSVGILFTYHSLNTSLLQSFIAADFVLLSASITTTYTYGQFKLNKAIFNTNLFEKRYEIFNHFSSILSETLSLDVDRDFTMKKNEILHKLYEAHKKSYFLFNENTFKFLEKFKEEIICYLYNIDMSSEDKIGKFNASSLFLVSLQEKSTLQANFPELKLNSY